VSIAGGMVHAVRLGLELGCEAIQVFTRNQRQWSPQPLDAADVRAFCREARAASYAGRIVSHASYLINLCATDPAILRRSRDALVDEVERAARLSIRFVCVHPGSHLGRGEREGVQGVAASLRDVLGRTRGRRVMILLENTAGQGTNLGARLEHLAELLRVVRSRRLGVCIDTCHLFAAGYDLRAKRAYEKTMRKLDDVVGLERVRALHLNDSRFGCGARRDRHAHIGEGEIGPAAFRRLVNDARFAELPGLLETPGDADGYRRNLARLRTMRSR